MTAATAEVRSPKTVKEGKEVMDEIDPDEGFVEHRTLTRQWIEYALLCLCNVGWTIDAALLPLFFSEIQELFDVSQTSLSMLSTAKGWAAAVFAFPCGFIAELLPRPQLVGMGMAFWATGLFVCAASSSFEMMFVGRVLNGMGLGIVQPLLLSLVADKNPPSKRGSAYGCLFFVGAVCNTLFGLVATRYAASSVAGIAGWRVSVACCATFSSLVGLAIATYVSEPNAEHLAERRKTQGFLSGFVKNLPKVFELFKYPTFVLIICQGAPGTAPWTVFPFFTQWLELSCFTHAETAWIFSTFGWGIAFSQLVSGLLLNFVARRFPNHGPPTIANFSVAIGIPFLVLLFFILPKPAVLGEGGEHVAVYCFTFLAFGVGAAMCGTLNKKVFSDIVPPAILTYVFAVDQLIENSVGNLAGVAVGLVTDKVFHYDAEAVGPGECAPHEAKKLGMGMFWVCNAGWLICFSVFLGMHFTYPKDRQRQLELRRAEAEAKKRDKLQDDDSFAAPAAPASAPGSGADASGGARKGGEMELQKRQQTQQSHDTFCNTEIVLEA